MDQFGQTAQSHPRYNNGSTTSNAKQQPFDNARPDLVNDPLHILLQQAQAPQVLHQDVVQTLGPLRMGLST